MATPGEIMRASGKPPEQITGPSAQAVAGPIDRATGLRWACRLIELAEADYSTGKSEVERLTTEFHRLRQNRFEMLHNIYTLLLVPALFQTGEAHFRNEARRRVTRAGLLALAHRRRHAQRCVGD